MMKTHSPILKFSEGNPRYEFTIETGTPVEFRIELHAKNGEREFLINQSGRIKHEGISSYFITTWESLMKSTSEVILKIVFDNYFEFHTFPTGYQDMKMPGIDILGEGIFALWKEVVEDSFYESGFFGIGEGDVVVDIGANVGIFSLLAKQRGAKRIIAIEPAPKTFYNLEQNTMGFGIECLMFAASESTGKKILNFADDGVNSFLESHEDTISAGYAEKVEVNTLDFNGLAEKTGITNIDYLKLDCEGSELEFISTINKEQWNLISRIGLETHSDEIHQGCKEILENNGFHLIVDESRITDWETFSGRILAYSTI
jgi:FkbM family methyltransferase